MSLGYIGICRKVAEDDYIVIYSYTGENWNDGGKSKHGDSQLQDGLFTIYKLLDSNIEYSLFDNLNDIVLSLFFMLIYLLGKCS